MKDITEGTCSRSQHNEHDDGKTTIHKFPSANR
jgi:hypothetical protein